MCPGPLARQPYTERNSIPVGVPMIENSRGKPSSVRAKSWRQRRESVLGVLWSCYTGPLLWRLGLVHERGVASTAVLWGPFQVTQNPSLIPTGQKKGHHADDRVAAPLVDVIGYHLFWLCSSAVCSEAPKVGVIDVVSTDKSPPSTSSRACNNSCLWLIIRIIVWAKEQERNPSQ